MQREKSCYSYINLNVPIKPNHRNRKVKIVEQEERQMKKALSCLLVLCLLLTCVFSAFAEGVTGETEAVEINGITYHKATDLTQEPITLT